MFEKLCSPLDLCGVIIVATFFLLVGYRPPWWNRKSAHCRRDIHDIPGPLSLPLLGTRWLFSLGGYSFNKIHEFYLDMYQKYGGIMKEEAVCNIPVISVFHKRDIEKVLKSGGKYPMRPPTEAIAQYRRSRPERYASTGLVNEQGETWHFLRQSLTTELTSPKTIFSFLPQLEEIADDWWTLLKHLSDENGRITNFEHVAGRLGLEATCALVLGRRMGFLLPDGESKTTRELAKAVHEHFIASRDTYFGLPIWKIFPTSSYVKLEKSEETIYKLVLELIESADDATKESAVFQSVLNANIDSREKTAAIVDFIAAGIHTLKNSLVFLLYLLAKHPQTQQKILEDTSNAYLKACITETFRILPTANCLARITEEELDLSGYKVPPGSVVLCHTGIACQDDQNFQQAKEFRPERWLDDEKSETASNSTFLVTPFGVGRRICPGKRFIEQVLPLIARSTVRKFELQVDEPLELQFEFLLAPKGPVSMVFKERF